MHRLAEQTVVVPVSETNVAAVTAQVEGGAGGVILFGNVAPANLASALVRLRAFGRGGVPPVIMTDEEGGAVQRMANLVGIIPSARQMGSTLTPTAIEALALTLGQRLRAAGVTMDLAPVLDIDGGVGPNDRDPDGTRAFSTAPAIAAADGLAFADGLRAAGIVPVVKHFPGLGSATANTDVRPGATLPWSVLRTSGLVPFQSAAQAQVPAVMVSNATIPGLTTLPASISAAVVTGLLRQQLAYGGLVLTDSLSAGAFTAIGYTVPRAAVAAIRAGADMVLFGAAAAAVPALTAAVVLALTGAVEVGTVSRTRLVDAVMHILAVKHVNLCSAP